MPDEDSRRQQATEVVKIQASLKRRKIVIIEAGVHDVFRLRSGQRSFVVSVVYVTSTMSIASPVPYLRSYS